MILPENYGAGGCKIREGKEVKTGEKSYRERRRGEVEGEIGKQGNRETGRMGQEKSWNTTDGVKLRIGTRKEGEKGRGEGCNRKR